MNGLPTRSRDLAAVIAERKSVRSFQAAPIPMDAVERAVEAAGWAPSPHGIQPWRFVMVVTQEAREKLADDMAASWRVQLALDEQDPYEVERRVQLSKDRLERAPVVVVQCLYLGESHAYPDVDRQMAERTMAIQSLGAAAQNFLLTLHAEGLDAGWMCAPLFCPDIARSSLGLEANLEPQAMFPVGLAARQPKRRPRRSVDALIVARR